MTTSWLDGSSSKSKNVKIQKRMFFYVFRKLGTELRKRKSTYVVAKGLKAKFGFQNCNVFELLEYL